MAIRFRFLCAALIILLTGSAMSAEPVSLVEDPHVGVVLWGIPIVTVRAHYRNYSPADRAAAIAQHIHAIPVSNTYSIELHHATEDAYQGAWIMVNSNRVFGLLEGDAQGATLDEYGAQVIERLHKWLQRRDAQKKPEILFKGALYSALASVCVVIGIYILVRGRKRLLSALEKYNRPKSSTQPLQVGGIYLVPYLLMLLSGIVRMIMFFLIGLLSYLWLAFVMSQFPYTMGTGQKLTHYIVDLVSDIGWAIFSAMPDLVMVGVIFWLASIVNDVIRNIFLRIESGRIKSHLFDQETAKATRRVFVVLVWIFALIIAYPYIPGSDTEAFKGVSVFIGLIVSLGSVGIVGQLLGGLIVVYSRAYQPGEYVKIGEYEGTVTAVGVLSTKIKTLRKEEITIPNAVLLSATSTNYSRLSKEDGLIVATTVTIGYDVPWQQVHHLLLAAASRATGVRAEPAPVVFQTALSDWYVEYRLLVHIDDPLNKVVALSQLHEQIQETFAEAKVQIMSPHFVAQPDNNVLPKQWIMPNTAVKQESDDLR